MFYTIGQMSAMTGVPASTLRYYDKEGLLPFVERSGGNARRFTDADYAALKVIECLKTSGLSIAEIKDFMEMTRLGDATLGERFELFERRRIETEKRLEELRHTLALINYKCWYYKTAVEAGTESVAANMDFEHIPPELREAKRELSAFDSGKTE